MDFGIALPTAADFWKVTKEAEEFGFTHAWFYDTQMLSADCFVAMGAAAVNTKRIRLGTGVLVPSNRIAPVAANALATLNQLAPGRIDFGVGTGFTARRAMGFGAIKVKDMETYIHQADGLACAAARPSSLLWEGQKKKICLPTRVASVQYQGSDRAPSLGLRAAHPGADSQAQGGLDQLRRQGRERHQRSRSHARRLVESRPCDGRSSGTAFALGCVLKDGEPADSERAMAQAGPRAAVMLHRAADEALAGLAPGQTDVVQDQAQMQGYIDLARDFEPKDAPYLQNHRGHLMFVKPEEKRFASAELISATSFTASEAEIKQRIEALRSADYTQFTIQLVPGHEHALADWARIRKAFA